MLPAESLTMLTSGSAAISAAPEANYSAQRRTGAEVETLTEVGLNREGPNSKASYHDHLGSSSVPELVEKFKNRGKARRDSRYSPIGFNSFDAHAQHSLVSFVPSISMSLLFNSCQSHRPAPTRLTRPGHRQACCRVAEVVVSPNAMYRGLPAVIARVAAQLQSEESAQHHQDISNHPIGKQRSRSFCSLLGEQDH